MCLRQKGRVLTLTLDIWQLRTRRKCVRICPKLRHVPWSSALTDVEVTEIENALAEFKREVAGGASAGEMRGRLTLN
jgi:hypothetical protein